MLLNQNNILSPYIHYITNQYWLEDQGLSTKSIIKSFLLDVMIWQTSLFCPSKQKPFVHMDVFAEHSMVHCNVHNRTSLFRCNIFDILYEKIVVFFLKKILAIFLHTLLIRRTSDTWWYRKKANWRMVLTLSLY